MYNALITACVAAWGDRLGSMTQARFDFVYGIGDWTPKEHCRKHALFAVNQGLPNALLLRQETPSIAFILLVMGHPTSKVTGGTTTFEYGQENRGVPAGEQICVFYDNDHQLVHVWDQQYTTSAQELQRWQLAHQCLLEAAAEMGWVDAASVAGSASTVSTWKYKALEAVGAGVDGAVTAEPEAPLVASVEQDGDGAAPEEPDAAVVASDQSTDSDDKSTQQPNAKEPGAHALSLQ
jgi:hypothetical protein